MTGMSAGVGGVRSLRFQVSRRLNKLCHALDSESEQSLSAPHRGYLWKGGDVAFCAFLDMRHDCDALAVDISVGSAFHCQNYSTERQ